MERRCTSNADLNQRHPHLSVTFVRSGLRRSARARAVASRRDTTAPLDQPLARHAGHTPSRNATTVAMASAQAFLNSLKNAMTAMRMGRMLAR
jgi:protein-disulfide isomerase-like protein with CxxC motif